MNVKFLNANEIDANLTAGKALVIAYAEWCGPCKMMAPTFEEMSNDMTVIKVDIDKNKEWAEEKGISSIPTIMIMDGKTEKSRMSGFATKEMIEANF